MNAKELVKICKEAETRRDAYAKVLNACGERYFNHVDFKDLMFIFAAIDKLMEPDKHVTYTSP